MDVGTQELFGLELKTILGLFLTSIFIISFFPAHQIFAQTLNVEKREELEEQLRLLEEEASAFDRHLQDVGKEKRTLASETATLDADVKRRQLEIKRLDITVRKIGLEIQNKTARISELSKKIEKNRKALASSLLLLYTYGEESIFSVLLRNWSLSEFFGTMHDVEKVQENIESALGESKEERELLGKEKKELQEIEVEQQELKALQEVERRFLAQKKKEKEELLRLTKGKEALFEQLLKSKKRDIATLKTQLFYLEKTGILAEDAIRFADLAAKRAGIRTEFLLALLEVETGKQFEDGVISVGTNLGTGHWKRDLYDCYANLGRRKNAEAEKNAFFKITNELGLDPDKMPVSRKPNYGCGGAMGPAQFLPTTWLRFAPKVAELTGHNPPSPWNVEDAFTASAVFLSQSGAASKTNAGEIAAAKTYISGRPNCASSICRVYSNRIVSLARDIGRIL